MTNIYLKEIDKLNHSNKVNKTTLKQFTRRLTNRIDFTKDDNITDHICAFFVPINIETKSIYLGHHIKANDWIPPGGHIKKGEHPLETIKREFIEELEFKLTNQPIELINISIKHIDNAKHKCKIHYDFWYLINIEKINFKYIKKEFYDANWFSIEKALQLTKTKVFNEVMEKIFK